MARPGLARHPRDTTSLVLGLLLLGVAGLFLVADTTELAVDGRWAAPGVLVLVGVAGLLSALRPAPGEPQQRDEPEPPR